VDAPKADLVILLVEDNPGDVFLVREALVEAGFSYDLHVVQDGASALDFLLAHTNGVKPRPDLVILDLNLPCKNGREVMAEMQAHAQLKSLPVAVLSTSCSESDIGLDFPHLRSTFAAKTAQFAQLVDILRNFRQFALQTA
jgi:two-component system, chemotaxis family, response regulator Rcp1